MLHCGDVTENHDTKLMDAFLNQVNFSDGWTLFVLQF